MMSQQAIITLTATTPGIVPPTRVLKLNPERLSVPIGRASKSVSKGLISAEENAWFDNPVMSRDHAELVFDPDDMAILIKDIRSMHGTMVNDKKVPVDTLQQVRPGDVVSFGAEVRRGSDTFPPCCFKIGFEFAHWMSAEIPLDNCQSCTDCPGNGHVFQCPDSSDIEDNQDLFEDEQVSREGDETPAESPLPKISAATDAIDLTKEDMLPMDASPQGLALDDTSCSQMYTSRMGQSPNCHPVEILEHLIRIDDVSSDELDDEMEESDQQDNEETDASDDNSDKENMEESSDESEDIAEGSTCDSDSEISDPKPPEKKQDPSEVSGSHIELHQPQVHPFHDNKDIPISSIRSTVIRSADPAQPDNQDPNEYARSVGHFSCAISPSALDTSQLFTMEGDGPCVNDENQQQLRPYVAAEFSTGPAPSLAPQMQSFHRQPSPSDAALAKSFRNECPVAPSSSLGLVVQTGSSTYAESDVPDTWNQAKAQSLGDKTGKHEFFQAREINRTRANVDDSRHQEHKAASDGISKAKFNHLGHPYNPRPPPTMNSSPPGQQNYSPPNYFSGDRRPYPQTLNHHQQLAQQQQIAQQKTANQQHLLKLAQQQQMAAQIAAQIAAQNTAQRLAAQHCAFASRNSLGDFSAYSTAVSSEPQTSPGPIRPISPEPDMTSAVKFNQSKLLIAAQRTTSQPGRSAVRIDDIVERSVVEKEIKSLKRKASEISEVLEEEVRVWASKDSSVFPDKSGSSSDQVVDISPKSRDDSSYTDTTIGADANLQQPAAKKLKRFAENVAYFALGGIALSAGLFSVLVNTAPNFSDA